MGTALGEIYATGGITDEELNETVDPRKEKEWVNPELGYGKISASRMHTYMGMRYGGMGYGPAFRLCRDFWRKGPAKSDQTKSMAPMRLHSDKDCWEPMLS